MTSDNANDVGVTAEVPGVRARLGACRARGDQQADPVRFRFIEAMAQRADALQGEARRVIEQRILQLLDIYEGGLLAPRADAASDVIEGPSPLAGLLAHLAQQAASFEAPAPAAAATAAVTTAAGTPPGRPAPPTELRTLRQFRSTWAQLSADRRLSQSLAKVPENAGPLNSQHLAQRALTLMRDLSPAYFQHFLSHVDALLWLEAQKQGNAPAASAPANARADGSPPRKRARSTKKT